MLIVVRQRGFARAILDRRPVVLSAGCGGRDAPRVDIGTLRGRGAQSFLPAALEVG